MEIIVVLNALEKLETELGNFYEWLSEKLADEHDDTSGFFFRMSTQERSHANLVRYGKRLVHQNGHRFQNVDVNLDPLNEFIASIASFREEHSRPRPTEALLFAMKLETDTEVDVHRSAIESTNPEFTNLMKSLADADRKHFETLKEFANRHSQMFSAS
ncbi:MAG: hypothetical protein GY906_28115 [bacterium]|nr:hypothetical protein [bacterium]